MRIAKLVFVPFLMVAAGCASTLQPIPPAWLSLPSSEPFSTAEIRVALAGAAPLAEAPPYSGEPIRIVTDQTGARLFRGDTPLTPAYAAIESFDVSGERLEVVFSARRESNFDIGLVAVEGSQVNWIPEDPADEVSPKWAPRGNKASFVVRNRGGDLVRTVHIPTAVALVVDFPFGTVRELLWDPPAERFAVAWDTVDASERVEVMRYGGENRRMALPPRVRLEATVTPFAGGLLLRPGSTTYGEKLPLVVWIAEGERNRWDDARGALLSSTRMAGVILDRAPGEGLGKALRESEWIDHDRIYVVRAGKGAGSPAVQVPGAVVIRGDDAVPTGYYRRAGDRILVNPADVKSFAARFIAEDLKGIAPRGR